MERHFGVSHLNRSIRDLVIVFLDLESTSPQDDFLEKDMIELYPLQLQQGDDPWGWVRYVNALRQLPIQYSQATVLPLPLHLAKNLSEYLFDV